MSFRKVISVACQLQGLGAKIEEFCVLHTSEECSTGAGGQRVVKDKKLHLFEFNWKTQTQNAIFAKAKRNGKQGAEAEGAEGRKPINRSKLQQRAVQRGLSVRRGEEARE